MQWVYLFAAIGAEVFATSCLKLTHEFTRLWPSLLVVCGYGVSFYLLSLVIRSIPVGVAYALWSGLGIVLVALVGFFAYGQKLDAAALGGMGLIMAGAIVINLFSKTVGH